MGYQSRLECPDHPELPEHGRPRRVLPDAQCSSDGEPLPQAVGHVCSTTPINKDRFENTAWTINGRLGDLKAVYTGAYLVRNVSQVQDYTNYARGVYADYYQCHGAEPANGLASKCYSPSATWNEIERNTHQSHEIRLSTPDDWRLRGIVGAFWEELKSRSAELALQDPARPVRRPSRQDA